MVTLNPSNPLPQTQSFVGGKSGPATLKITAYNIGGLKLSNLTTLEKVSKFVTDIVNRKKITDTETAILVALKVKLDVEIKKNDTSGIFNFFKYLFRRTEKVAKQRCVEEMDAVKKLIDNIKIANKKKPGAKKKVTFVETAGKEKSIDSPAEKNGSKKASGIFNPDSDGESPKHAGSDDKSPQGISGEGQAQLNSSTDSSIPSAPFLDDPSVPQAPDMDSSIPAAPLFGSLTEIGVPAAPVFGGLFGSLKAKKPTEFANEPKEPKLNLSAPLSMDAAKIQEELKVMEPFIEQLKAVVDPIEAKILREKDLETQLKEAEKQLQIAETTIKSLEKLVAALEQDKPVVKLKLKLKKEDFVQMPFFSDKKFAEINQMLEKKGAAPLALKFLKSEQLSALSAKLKKAQKEKAEWQESIKSYTQELKEIRGSENNKIPFKDFKDLLAKKKLTLSKWTAGLNLRKKKLVKIAEDAKKPKEAVKQEQQPKVVKPNLEQVVQDKEVAKQHPELAEIVKMGQNQDAAIILKAKAAGFEDLLAL